MKEIGKIIRFQNTHQSEDFQATNVEDFKDVPFHIRRTYWTYDIPEGAARGGHAHRECLEVIVAASGSFTVTLMMENGSNPIFSTAPTRDYSSTQVSGERWKTSLPVRSVWSWLRNYTMKQIISMITRSFSNTQDIMFEFLK